MNKLTEQTAPKGARVLCTTYHSSGGYIPSYLILECDIVQWSKEGRLKLKYVNTGVVEWMNVSSIPYLVEVLYIPRSIKDIVKYLKPKGPNNIDIKFPIYDWPNSEAVRQHFAPTLKSFNEQYLCTFGDENKGVHIHSVGGQSEY